MLTRMGTTALGQSLKGEASLLLFRRDLMQAHVVSHYRAHTVRVADLSNNLRATDKYR